MAATGLVLYGFVLAHLAGNLQIFLGRGPLNAYAEKLKDLALLLWSARLFLLFLAAVHVLVGILLALENKRARPVSYVKERTVQATLSSRTMVISGVAILAFVIYHLLHYTLFVVNPEYAHLTDSLGRHDVYSMVVTGFSNPWISATYIIAVFGLSFHLSHSFSSLCQTLGFTDARRLLLLKGIGVVAAWGIFLGYSSIPAACLLGVLRLPPGVG